MKKLLIPVIASILCLLLTACAPAEEYPFSPTALEKRFGDTMDEVVEDLGIDLSTAEVQEISEEQIDILLPDVTIAENKNVIGLTMSFYNDIFCYISYVSDDAGFMYDYATALCEDYEKKYGEDVTDPNWPYLRKNVNREAFLNGNAEFREQWKIENKEVSEAVYNGEEIKLQLFLDSIKSENEETVSSGMTIRFAPLSQAP